MAVKLSFKAWEKQCDKLLKKKIGMGIYYLPDAHWWDMYDGEYEPEDALQEAFEYRWQDYIPIGLWEGKFKL